MAIANARGISVGKLISEVNRQRQVANLSSAIRTRPVKIIQVQEPDLAGSEGRVTPQRG